MKRKDFFTAAIGTVAALFTGKSLLGKKELEYVGPRSATEAMMIEREKNRHTTSRGIIPFITEEVTVYWPIFVDDKDQVFADARAENAGKGNILRSYERFGMKIDVVLLQGFGGVELATAKHPLLKNNERIAMTQVFYQRSNTLMSCDELGRRVEKSFEDKIFQQTRHVKKAIDDMCGVTDVMKGI